MKIVDKYFADENEIAFSKMAVEYRQNLDCCQDDEEFPDGCQLLKITTCDGGGGKFFRITTSNSGWSFDKFSEVEDIFNDFFKRFKCDE